MLCRKRLNAIGKCFLSVLADWAGSSSEKGLFFLIVFVGRMGTEKKLHALEKEGAVRLWRDWACCVMRGGNELVAGGNWLHVRS